MTGSGISSACDLLDLAATKTSQFKRSEHVLVTLDGDENITNARNSDDLSAEHVSVERCRDCVDWKAVFVALDSQRQREREMGLGEPMKDQLVDYE